MEVDLKKIIDLLNNHNNFYILTHSSPDGDTLGSAYALCLALQKLNKNVKVLCNDEIPEKYSFLYKNVKLQNFNPEFIISTDVADTKLLGDKLSIYSNKVDLCIDHHVLNSKFADLWYIDSNAAATCEIIFNIINNLKVEIDKDIATCIYTGISTDTGCFRHINATSKSYRIAAEMIDHGADAFSINRLMFDTKTKAQLELERLAIEKIEFSFEDKCAMIILTKDELDKIGIKDSDTNGISSIPREVKGVLIGITLREKEKNVFKASVRTDETIDASMICSQFGGGGHKCAAGFIIKGGIFEIKGKIQDKILGGKA